MKLFLKITAGVVGFSLFVAGVIWLGKIDNERYAEKMAEKQAWCLAEGGDFTRHGVGWGPDWSCTITNGK